MSGAAFTLVYITSRGHSGSTLTELLLDAHPAITSLGEVKQLNTARGAQCRCGGVIPEGCSFWRRVDLALAGRSALRLRDVEASAFAAPDFALQQRALLAAVAAVSGHRILLDSSKSLNRLSALLAANAFPIRVIHLVRSPYGVVYSNAKRGRDWVEHSRNYARALIQTRRLLAARREPSLEVRYEDLADDPQGELRRIMRWLGLELHPAQLRWAEQESHTIYGNPMRFTRDSSVRRDDGWRTGLRPLQKLGVAWWALPARVPGSWLRRAQRRLRRTEDWLLGRS
jgi:hypothetical protein